MGEVGVPDAASADAERKYVGLLWPRELAIVRGGNLLIRFSPFMPLSSSFARRLLWAAKASRGDNSGGTSPAICKRGDGRLLGDGRPVPIGP